jgi:acyl-CoA reductase-like NAD-dependent aldehyde dehydrogenase
MSRLPPELQRQFDEFAAKARVEFEANWKTWTALDVAKWWDRWCQFGKTNHDRLGRILMEVTGVKWKATYSQEVSREFLKELGIDDPD